MTTVKDLNSSGRTPGFILAAPASGSGKTLTTLGLLRAFQRQGLNVQSAKVGPDYIDPAFHTEASGAPCINLDTWAMRPDTVTGLVAGLESGADLILAEGVMGLFDGAMVPGNTDPARNGSTAALARLTGWPVVLVVNVKGQASSAAAVVRGFATHDPDVTIAGVIFNNVGMGRHADILFEATQAAVPDVKILGCIPKTPDITVPERHLGLVQAHEHADLPRFLDQAADLISAKVDIDALLKIASSANISAAQVGALKSPTLVPPIGQRIAIAQDVAFGFCYPTLINGWRAAGADITFFSPLANEAPDADADAVYLPGGYPELHAGTIAANTVFLDGVRSAANAGKTVFGECGGYMTLGQVLTDKDGIDHVMLGLLPLETSYAKRRLHMGYRVATLLADTPFAAKGSVVRAHEFHYASIITEDTSDALFTITDAAGTDKGTVGQVRGSVYGSFMHLIDREIV